MPIDDNVTPRPAGRVLLAAGALLAAAALSLTGCATPNAADTDAAAPTAPSPEQTSTSPAPADTPIPTQTPTPEPSPAVIERSTVELLDACLAAVGEDNDPASEQLSRSTIESDRARSAFRPDRLWYVVVPVDDPTVDVPVEYACLLTTDLTVDSSWGRIAPDTDDFDQWSSATEPAEGL